MRVVCVGKDGSADMCIDVIFRISKLEENKSDL